MHIRSRIKYGQMNSRRMNLRVCCWFSFIVLINAWLHPRHSCFLRLGKGCIDAHTSFIRCSISDVETLHGPWNSTNFAATRTWGRQPLLLQGAFESVVTLPSPLPSWQEIIELACCAANDDEQDMAESLTCRLIQHTPKTLDSFTVELGPFEDADKLDNLLRSNDQTIASTLVVNDVDRWIPDLSDWMDAQFDFLPRWRRDDAQVSLAATGGGIGLHVDNYDVFLLQTSGHREWEIGLEPISVEEEFDRLVEESQVRILNLTDIPMTTIKLRLGPGDCLYLPPRFVHCGTATSDDCITLSVGCRAPSAADLLSKLAESVADSTRESIVRRYSDENIFHSPSRSLNNEVKTKMKHLLLDLVHDVIEDDNVWDDLVGKLITSPNRPVFDYPTPLYDMDPDWKANLGPWGDAETALNAVLSGKGDLRRAEGVSFAWSISTDPLVGRLYAQGRVFYLEGETVQSWMESLLDRIANGLPIDHYWLTENAPDRHVSSPSRTFLCQLLTEGLLYGDDVDSQNISLQE